MNERSYYLGAYLFVVARKVPHQINRFGCADCNIYQGPGDFGSVDFSLSNPLADLGRYCPGCGLPRRWLPGDVIQVAPTLRQLLPDNERLAQAYPVNREKDQENTTVIYLVPNLVESGAITSPSAALIMYPGEIEERKRNFDTFYQAEIDQLEAMRMSGNIVVGLVTLYGFFECEEL